MMVHIGDTVKRYPITFGDSTSVDFGRKLVSGTVVYVHPLGRFHVVAFGRGQACVRESFYGADDQPVVFEK